MNGTPIGRWSAQRTWTAPDGNHTYLWEAWTDERRVTGDVQHQFADGALLLAQKVLVAAHAALAEPEPPLRRPVLWDAQMRADARARLAAELQDEAALSIWHGARSARDRWPRCGASPVVRPNGASSGVVVVDEGLVTCPVCLENPPRKGTDE